MYGKNEIIVQIENQEFGIIRHSSLLCKSLN
jgi:hypothetical protein